MANILMPQIPEDCWYADTADAPCTMQDIWQRTLGADKLAQLSLAEKNQLARAALGYILCLCNFNEMRRIIRSAQEHLAADDPRRITVDEIGQLRLSLFNDFRTVLALKIVIIRCEARRMQGQPSRINHEIRQANQQIDRRQRASGVVATNNMTLLPADAQLYRHLGRMGWRSRLRQQIYDYPSDVIPTIRELMQQCDAMLGKLKDFIGKFVNKKHRFIMHSQNMEFHDINADVTFQAICGFYRYVTLRGTEHMDNTVKRVVHNAGISLINYYTKPERARVRRREDGMTFEGMVRGDLDNIADRFGSLAHEQAASYVSAVNHTMGLASFMRAENLMTLRDYVNSQKSARRAEQVTRILQLLAMQPDEEFIRHAQQRTQRTELDSNELIYNTLGHEVYLQLMSEVIPIKLQVIQRVIRDLRDTLIP